MKNKKATERESREEREMSQRGKYDFYYSSEVAISICLRPMLDAVSLSGSNEERKVALLGGKGGIFTIISYPKLNRSEVHSRPQVKNVYTTLNMSRQVKQARCSFGCSVYHLFYNWISCIESSPWLSTEVITHS